MEEDLEAQTHLHEFRCCGYGCGCFSRVNFWQFLLNLPYFFLSNPYN